ncbi:hypothetical protein CspeluHIS016_0100150 [Cutaneotrichosporon spelunceum]|uniref:Zn(2)-C6 fungal-type domain-containing protein n=1 Tax=Cutaneotrichosporon spelunceum TaxID=1672016 RepID=A0AAD3TMX5_9TREE|nr:hypothetical protein CspeluHIS016_0100150 [Cutaneotrichosporon spelunceum]
MADRACHRCIAKKRRCDHQRPVCGTCKKLNLDGECAYPPPQLRRGPVAGMSRRAEHRAQQCENALWFLLNLPGVQDAIDRVDPDVLTRPFVPAPTADLERGERNEWWGEHTMRQPADILGFRDACRRLPGGTRGGQGDHDSHDSAETDVRESHEGHEHDGHKGHQGRNGHERHDGHAGHDSHTRDSHNSHNAEPYDEYYHARTHSPVPQPQPERRRDEMRNAMGPSLWQLVTAAIPDDDEPRRPSGGEDEWARPMWSAPVPREDYPDGKRKRRADLFW